MECKDYGSIDDLEVFISMAVEDAKVFKKTHNYSIQVKLDKRVIFSEQLASCGSLAKSWQALQPPRELYFNHGQFIGPDGIKHIIDELKEKPTSNRALYSLIAQDQIVSSYDKPIPSFMILQCAIEGSTVYCTTYFRALEVSEFLKINVAEIKLVLSQILKEFTDTSEVILTILAFTAYVTEGFNTLQRPEIDCLLGEDFPGLLIKNPEKIGILLEEKARPSSVVEVASLLTLLRVIENKAYEYAENEFLMRARIKSLLSEAIEKGNHLAGLRKRHSKHEAVDAAEKDYIELLKSVAKEFIKK